MSQAKQLSTMMPVVAKAFGVKIQDVFSATRRQPETTARHVMYVFLREEEHKTFADIGALFDRGHPSVVYGVKTINELASVDKKFKQTLEQLRETCYGRKN